MKLRLLGAVCAFSLMVISATGYASLLKPAGLGSGDALHRTSLSATLSLKKSIELDLIKY